MAGHQRQSRSTSGYRRIVLAVITLAVLASTGGQGARISGGTRVSRAAAAAGVALTSSRDGALQLVHQPAAALQGGGLRRMLATRAAGGADSKSHDMAAAAAGARLHSGGEELCAQLVLRAAATGADAARGGGQPSLQQQQQRQQQSALGARLSPGSCGRLQQVLLSDLTQAAAHLGIRVTQPFAPAACQLQEEGEEAAAAAVAAGGAGEAGLSAISSGTNGATTSGGVVLARWRVCGRPAVGEAPGLVAWALQLQLESNADAYYAAGLGPDFDTCPTRLSGLVASLEVVQAPGTSTECVTLAHQQPLTGPCASVRAGSSSADAGLAGLRAAGIVVEAGEEGVGGSSAGTNSKHHP
ncbi:hypothetical protein HYH02_015110 [Chlamydomonas schloesseri]|uniref:Pherophorin domain-containing protein n=1 Tax=Chlamydomonas schloesseri TaxID=2026947 RepID=A0A835SHA9_9CHLO|nr:hypothetical protein HYH02_015110 [Chlamydomonas schloesseri]|eukprot:KAG2424847.1 hypothetical protein HYH02_015110 [Chlamydomonas schloesseri]